MGKNSALVINPIREKEMIRILPYAPQASSTELNWKHLNVSYYQLPSVECPEHTLSKHVISLNLGAPARLERVIDRQVKSDRFTEGEVFSINPAGLYRTIRVVNPAQILHLYLEPEFVSHFAHDRIDPDLVEIIPSFHPHDPFLLQLGLTLKSAVVSGTEIDALYADAAATMLAAHLLRHYSTVAVETQKGVNGLSQSKLDTAIDYIHAHLDEDLSIDTLAKLVQISSYYFVRLFKQSMGLTPHAYIVRQRLERAKHLLKMTDLSIAEIAYRTGFCHQSRFSTVFRQYLHTSPRAYRDQK
ncbi:MAG: helix-turn-helix transcriptional regulator [Microcoleus sp. PH2017_29_MFU_D_A]|uniref:AraC family transcriptional regulator n=1 Tax=unclassified Microcoleus TaxID=2642155 RepID=UPI001DA39BFE|nr:MULTISPECIES: AraC family transcriptional regulator [unclassified Microcoleus]MCC3418194.1 helix-turn-helix transcriptional regulator [Microcoleus sp. PH2017_07_MST_O_A]MCC3512465.1 helix-turn-helix transcriptional regulator [Microcoleus sp. PH2017_17_BER_D_A]MCC3603623.1 helix-turn-helix transcriptional regulator [Microcoleus sp. PH2017_29_MFU_D_A]MCC3636692.1 helix-turn-helix transcriptional regulator [Microcoleus sp. PH2017_37_MFU_D_B]